MTDAVIIADVFISESKFTRKERKVKCSKYEQKIRITTQTYIAGCGLYCERDSSVSPVTIV